MRKMYKSFCKISLCIVLSLIILFTAGCSILDGGRLLKEVAVSVTPSPSPEPEPKGVGESWTSDTWDIKLAQIMEADSVGAAPYNEKAKEGKTLLLLFFDVTNISESKGYFNNIYFRAAADGEEVIQEIVSAGVIEGRQLALGYVEPEEIARYYVIYQVDKSWQTFEISYDIGGMNSEKLADFRFENTAE